MKKAITIGLLVFLVSAGLFGQNSGKGFNFQAVARNSDGSVKAEQRVQLLIRIYPTQEKTGVLYAENCEVSTDKFGVFSLIVGKGIYLEGSAPAFEDINFSQDDAYLNVALKEGSTETEIVHAPMLSVPYAESSIQADNGMPIGAIIPYAGMVPDNSDNITVYGCKGTWRLCNGAVYDNTIFTDLHRVLNNAWGTDRLPDLRGVFLRGTSYEASDTFSDPETNDRTNRNPDGNTGNKVGSFQGDETGPHDHSYQDKSWPVRTQVATAGNQWVVNTESGTPPATESITGTYAGGESRPKNANVNFIIRVK